MSCPDAGDPPGPGSVQARGTPLQLAGYGNKDMQGKLFISALGLEQAVKSIAAETT